MIAFLMAELNQSFDQAMRMSVDTAFDLMTAHRKNNEPQR